LGISGVLKIVDQNLDLTVRGDIKFRVSNSWGLRTVGAQIFVDVGGVNVRMV
jgi:hypothetical protein